MKTAVIGASGFIGQHLLGAYRAEFPDCVGTCCHHRSDDLALLDLRAPDIRPLRLVETGHQAVVVAAGQTSILRCEAEAEAELVNVRGTLALIDQLGRAGLHVLFLSTDNVFDGRTGNYLEASTPRPVSAYGRQKWQVEQELPSLCDRPTVIRLSKTFGLEKGDGTLLDGIAAELAAGRAIQAASDLIFNPTWVRDVVHAVLAVQQHDLRGTIHVAGPEPWSRHQLALELAEALGVDSGLVHNVRYADLGIAAQRPLNTSLRCGRIGELDTTFRSVRSCLAAVADHWR